jgi:hypothetical protein
VEAEAKAEAAEAVDLWWKRKQKHLKNMPLPLPVCFKVAVQIFADAC